MLKVFLSGHTSGIGKSLFSNLDKNSNFKISGGSRSNGYDIDSPEGRNKILKDCEDVDVIILGAHSGYSQVALLFELFEKYRDKNKKIIVFGSNSSRGIKSFPHPYAIEKKAVSAACEQLQNVQSALTLTLITTGWVRTSRTEKLTDDPMIALEEIYRLILYIISQPPEISLEEIKIRAQGEFDQKKMTSSPWS